MGQAAKENNSSLTFRSIKLIEIEVSLRGGNHLRRKLNQVIQFFEKPREVRVHVVIVSLFFIIYGIFGFGPGIDGIWSTTGIRSIYAFLFELLVILVFALYLLKNKSNPSIMTFNCFSLLGSLVITLILFARFPNLFKRNLQGDEITYLLFVKNLASASRLSERYANIQYSIEFNILIALLTLMISLLFYGAIFIRKNRYNQNAIFVLIFFILIRETSNFFIGQNYHYPLAFLVPTLISLTPISTLELIRLIWAFSVLSLLMLLLFQISEFKSSRAIVMNALIVVCALRSESVYFISAIEPIVYSIVFGIYIITITLMSQNTKASGSLISIFTSLRVTSLLWTVLLLRKSSKLSFINVRSTIEQIWARKSEFLVFLLVLPIVVHSMWRVLLGFVVSDTNRPISGFSQRFETMFVSMWQIYGFELIVICILAIITIRIVKQKSMLIKLPLFFAIFYSLVPGGAIEDNKYSVELILPIQISCLIVFISIVIRKTQDQISWITNRKA